MNRVGACHFGRTDDGRHVEIAVLRTLGPDAHALVRPVPERGTQGFAILRLAGAAALASAGLSRARSAGVVAMAPLGLCFLPAFVCLGIVPIVLSLFGEVLPS